MTSLSHLDLNATYNYTDYLTWQFEETTVHQFILHEQTEKYQLLAMYSSDDIAVPQLFPDCRIELNEVFETDN
ncbi:MAG: hypothetical protein ACRER2_08465 [Methylococcales bacterium]